MTTEVTTTQTKLFKHTKILQLINTQRSNVQVFTVSEILRKHGFLNPDRKRSNRSELLKNEKRPKELFFLSLFKSAGKSSLINLLDKKEKKIAKII